MPCAREKNQIIGLHEQFLLIKESGIDKSGQLSAKSNQEPTLFFRFQLRACAGRASAWQDRDRCRARRASGLPTASTFRRRRCRRRRNELP